MDDRIRFHLDEHGATAIADALRRYGIDATTTAGEDLTGASDERQLALATAQGRVLFTSDPDFLRLHAGGMGHGGIVFSPSNKRTLRQVIRGLVLIAELMTEEEMRNRVEYV